MTAAQNANRYTDKNGDAAGAAFRIAGYRGCVCYIAIISKNGTHRKAFIAKFHRNIG